MAKRTTNIKQGDRIVLQGAIGATDTANAASVDVSKQTAIVVAAKTKAGELVVKDQATCATANEMLLQLASARKSLEERKSFFVKPLKEHVKRIEALYSEPLKALDEADRTLRAKVVEFRLVEQKRLDVERRKREEELAKKQAEAEEARKKAEAAKGKRAVVAQAKAAEAASEANAAALDVLATPAQSRVMHTEAGQVASRKVWDFRVVDAEKVPRLYLVVDEAALRKAVRSGLRDIPGVQIFEKEVLSVGGM